MTAPKGLGRLAEWDPKNLDYPLPRKAVPRSLRSRYWWVPEVVDQGDKPHCVGYSGYTWLRSGPIYNQPSLTPDELYFLAQDHDEWPGRDYEGSSGLGLMKGLKEKGYVSEYRWALDAETAFAWVLTTSPVLFGTDWYSGMSKPDKWGFLQPEGESQGGHEWCACGAARDKKCSDGSTGAFRMVNTWGRSWGDSNNGRAWISAKAVQKLLEARGDCVTPTEILVAPNKVLKAPLEVASAEWSTIMVA
jgi:hypothetical protein